MKVFLGFIVVIFIVVGTTLVQAIVATH